MSASRPRDEEAQDGNGPGDTSDADHSSAANLNGNGHGRRKRSPIGAMIEDFEPTWFTICMNSGILAIVMHQFPYQFSGLDVISTVAYVIDLVLFVVFSCIISLRIILHFRETCNAWYNSVEPLAFLGCWPIAFLTIAANTGLIVSNASWGGHAFTIVAYVIWWIGAVWMISFSVMIYFFLFRNKAMQLDKVSTTTFIPAVGVATMASTGALICNYSFEISARLQVPIIITSYVFLGQGLFVALCVYSYVIQRFFSEGFPPAEKLPAMFLLLGPTGQVSTALQLLGTAAHGEGAFESYNRGTFIQGSAASGLDSAGILLALLIFGFGTFLAMVAAITLLESVIKGEQKWSMTWWSTIFPLGTVNTAMLVFSNEMDSRAWRVLTAGLLIILVIDYLICAAFTIYGILFGELLIPKDARKSKQT